MGVGEEMTYRNRRGISTVRTATRFCDRSWLLRGLCLAAALFALAPSSAHAIDWSSVPGRPVVLYYPGQSSWEWSLTPADMSGATKFRQEGKACRTCHDDADEKRMGQVIVPGTQRSYDDGRKLPPIEPTPIAGKPGWIAATVKFANDGTNLYVHLDFREGAQPNARQDSQYATKVSVMFSPAQTPDIRRGGCFVACHDDSAGMPSAGGSNRTLYLGQTRVKLTRQGGGDTLKPAADLAKLKADGYFMEYWQADLNPGQPAQAKTGIIFDKRETVQTVSTAEANYANGQWSVTLSRRLDAGPDLVRFAPGRPYVVAFSIHAGNTNKRFHYVSHEREMSLDSGAGEFVAVRK